MKKNKNNLISTDMRLRFGTSGVPLSSKKSDTISGIKRVRELGLEHMEMGWVHGVRIKEKTAKEIKKVAEGENVTLTVHAPYYINLNAVEPNKRAASRKRIVDSCVMGQICGAESVCFHAAFYLRKNPEKVFDQVLEEMKKIEEELVIKGVDKVWMAPELTGKATQFGDMDELIALSQSLNQTRLCVDFAHYFARYIGSRNSYDEFTSLIKMIKNQLDAKYIQDLHIHFSGIEYGEKGERRHLDLIDSEFNWKALLKALKDEEVGGYMVCEGPNLEKDALKAMEYFNNL